jgi:hypothetical protein
MLSSDEAIPAHAMKVVDAFVSKNDAPARFVAGDQSNLR